MKKRLLAICYEFAPATTPTAIRSAKLLALLPEWEIDVITIEASSPQKGHVRLHSVDSWTPHTLLRVMAKFKLEKVMEWLIWPDDKIFWVLPAVRKAHQLFRERNHDAAIVFMMPYSAGIIGLLLKRLTRLPMILNLDDSLTCTDMHPNFCSRLHYYWTKRLEDRYVQRADAAIYVSEFNQRMVQIRQPKIHQSKLHLIRYGADPADFPIRDETPSPHEPFRVVYLGGMTGWHQFLDSPEQKRSIVKKLYRWWMELGRYHLVQMDQRSSSPVFVGKAIQQVIREAPSGQDKIQLEIYGNRYSESVVSQVLESQQITDVVTVSGPVPNSEAIQIAQNADLLFMALPGRCDGSPGGRISAKTYEYLMTDRPILAALPPGENRDYLVGKPGVWVVAPDDVKAMASVIRTLAVEKAKGRVVLVDRRTLQTELNYHTRAAQLEHLLDKVILPLEVQTKPI